MSAEEWAMRVDLAACYRIVARFGMSDLVYNHITAKVPGREGRFLINPLGLMYDEVTASNLVEIDFDGNITSPTRHRINRAGFVIHSAIHRARPDAFCVLHTHSRAGVAVACLKDGFRPMTQGGLQFDARIGYHDYEGFNVQLDERERLVASIGRHHALILRNHGLLTVGDSVPKAVQRMYYLEQACQVMVDALGTGLPPVELSDQVRTATTQRWQAGSSDASANDDVEWAALLRLMDRVQPGYAS